MMTLPKRRKMLLSGGVLALIGAGLSSKKILNIFTNKNILEMPHEYRMLKNIAERKSVLKSSQLTIKNANFDKSFDEYISCENTSFVDCEFEPGSGIRIRSLKNVHFLNCDLNDTNISGGIWNNVKFTDCSANGQFLILGDEGSNNLEFENCDFSGPLAVEGSDHQNHFGAVGSYGDATFNNCRIKFARVIGETALTIKSSQLDTITASAAIKSSDLMLESVVVKNYITFKNSIFSKFILRNCEYDFMNLDGIESKSVALENCNGHFVGKFMTIGEMEVRNSTFVANGKKRDSFDNRMAAFSIVGSTILRLALDGLKFSGTNGTMYLGGTENLLYEEAEPASNKFISSKIKIVSINKTPLKGAYLGHALVEELTINNSEIADSNFTNSQFEKISLTNVELSGKIDFSETHIKSLLKNGVSALPDLTIISDSTKLFF